MEADRRVWKNDLLDREFVGLHYPKTAIMGSPGFTGYATSIIHVYIYIYIHILSTTNIYIYIPIVVGASGIHLCIYLAFTEGTCVNDLPSRGTPHCGMGINKPLKTQAWFLVLLLTYLSAAKYTNHTSHYQFPPENHATGKQLTVPRIDI